MYRTLKSLVPRTVRNFAKHLISDHDARYSRSYYETDVESAAHDSADIMAKSMIEWSDAKSVVDVGCGTGALLSAFRDLNRQVRGLEYATAGIEFCRERGLWVDKFNIERDEAPRERFDLCVSFEVAEHLLPAYATRYVAILCALSDRVVMSAATPGQGGTDHVNERANSYWIRKFVRNGFSFDAIQTLAFRDTWHQAGAAPWYSGNVMAFSRHLLAHSQQHKIVSSDPAS